MLLTHSFYNWVPGRPSPSHRLSRFRSCSHRQCTAYPLPSTRPCTGWRTNSSILCGFQSWIPTPSWAHTWAWSWWRIPVWKDSWFISQPQFQICPWNYFLTDATSSVCNLFLVATLRKNSGITEVHCCDGGESTVGVKSGTHERWQHISQIKNVSYCWIKIVYVSWTSKQAITWDQKLHRQLMKPHWVAKSDQ